MVIIFLRIIFAIIVFLCMLFLAYVVSKYIGQKSANSMKGNHLKLIESINIGIDKSLLIIKAGEDYYLISSCGKTVQKISKINIDKDIIEKEKLKEQKNNPNINFVEYINSFLKKGTIYNKNNDNENIVSKINNNLEKIKTTNDKLKRGKDE